MPRGTNPELELYLQLVFPWDAASANLFKGVSWTFFDNRDQKTKVANYVAQTYDQLLHLIESRASRPNANVYVGLGTQLLADITGKKSVDGYAHAIRKIHNIKTFNSIYLDLDVKPGAYATTSEAIGALDGFVKAKNLPMPTMVVLSGSGGVHVYWCFDKPVPVPVWSILAVALRDHALSHQLKFDPAVTVNAAGILRPPSTFNYKINPPGQVMLFRPLLSGQRYPVAALATPLAADLNAVQNVQNAQSAGGSTTRISHNAAFIDNTPTGPVPKLEDVIAVCPALDDIYQREGGPAASDPPGVKGDSEPLWNLAVMAASFTDDPVRSAHKLSRAHREYDQASTDQKLYEKQNARAQNSNIGWPKCASFSPLHQACRTCPNYVHNKSPFNFIKYTQQTQFAPPNVSDPLGLLPTGYFFEDKIIKTTATLADGRVVIVPIFTKPVFDAGLVVEHGVLTNRLAIKTAIVPGVESWVEVNAAAAVGSPASCATAFSAVGLFVPDQKIARTFVVAWMNRLQEANRRRVPVSYGWTEDGGFTYADTTHRASGPEAAFRGSTALKQYAPRGEMKPWQDAMQLAYGNPHMETLVATAFAAPLVEFTGVASIVMSACSAESGVGKTTSLMLGQSVWGDPIAGMNAVDDTDNSLMVKLPSLRSLPVYYDEIKTSTDLGKAVTMVLRVTMGKAKARLNRDSKPMDVGTFTTMLVVASNYGILDAVYEGSKSTQAGGLRVFEMRIPPLAGGAISDAQARNLLTDLKGNYGRAGERYAAFLGTNAKMVKEQVRKTSAFLEQHFKFTGPERFWSMTMASIISGAQFANDCGLTRFNIPAIFQCLSETLQDMRIQMATKDHVTLASGDVTTNVINEMISTARGTMSLLVTDKIHLPNTRGKPLPTSYKADGGIQAEQLRDIWIQIGKDDDRIRIELNHFVEWVRKRGFSPDHVLGLLGKDYVVFRGKLSFGAGCDAFPVLSKQRRQCIDLTPKATAPGSSPGDAST